MGGDEHDAHDTVASHIQKLPTLKVNSNDLSWLKEQKASKDISLLQEDMSGDVVRISSHTKKVSRFYVPPVDNKEDCESPCDEVEEAKDFSGAVKESEGTKGLAKDSPLTSFSGVAITLPTNIELYCECGGLCEGDNSQCSKCLEKRKPVEFSGHLFAQVNSATKLCWFHLLNKELYCMPRRSYRHDRL